MFRGGRNCIIGIFAIAMGAGILIAAIFPTGLLMFLVATLLIASGCACWKRWKGEGYEYRSVEGAQGHAGTTAEAVQNPGIRGPRRS